MKKAIITLVTRGKNKGQFRFTLIGINGEPVANSHPETYTQKHSCIETLESNFPDFVIIHTTVPGTKTNIKLK